MIDEDLALQHLRTVRAAIASRIARLADSGVEDDHARTLRYGNPAGGRR